MKRSIAAFIMVSLMALTVVSGAGILRAQAQPTPTDIANALDCSSLPFAWTSYTSGPALLGVSSAAWLNGGTGIEMQSKVTSSEPAAVAQVSTSVTGPGVITFNWGQYESAPKELTAWICLYDDSAAFNPQMYAPFKAAQLLQGFEQSYFVPSGTHTLRWTMVQNYKTSGGTTQEAVATLDNLRWKPGDTATTPQFPLAISVPLTGKVNTPVTLTGSAKDAENDIASYQWVMTNVPTGSKVPIGNLGSGSSATFTPDVVGQYYATLTATDSHGFSSSFGGLYAYVDIGAPLNNPPTVTTITVPTTPVNVNSPVKMQGAGKDPDSGDALTYQWAVTSVPSGSKVPIGDLQTATDGSAAFVPDVPGQYVVAFTVTDSHGAHDTQTATITAALGQNHPPAVIITTPSAAVNVNSPVKLAGSATDAGNDIKSYQWALTSVPQGSSLQPGNLATKPDHTASFTPDRMGQYTVTFTVTDSQGAQSIKTATIVANPTKALVAQDYEKFERAVAKQPIFAFVPGTKTALVSALAVNEFNVNSHRYGVAARNLQASILPRMDGCAKSGSPDKNDAVRTAAAQKLLYPQLTYLIQELQWLQVHPS